MTVIPFTTRPPHPADPLIAFLTAESRDKAEPSRQRYEQVISSLMEFMEDVDVEPVYGPEIAAHLDERREALVSHAFLPTLGYAGLVRALPLFLTEPWLPPPGQQRASHRSLVDRLLVFLRRQGLIDAQALRSDLKAARHAIGTARSRDYAWPPSSDPASGGDTAVVTVDLELPTGVLDDLLADTEHRDSGTLADLISERLTPPRYDDPYPYGYRSRWE